MCLGHHHRCREQWKGYGVPCCCLVCGFRMCRYFLDPNLSFWISVWQEITRVLYFQGATWKRNYCHLAGPDTRPLAMARESVKMCTLGLLLVRESSSAKVTAWNQASYADSWVCSWSVTSWLGDLGWQLSNRLHHVRLWHYHPYSKQIPFCLSTQLISLFLRWAVCLREEWLSIFSLHLAKDWGQGKPFLMLGVIYMPGFPGSSLSCK